MIWQLLTTESHGSSMGLHHWFYLNRNLKIMNGLRGWQISTTCTFFKLYSDYIFLYFYSDYISGSKIHAGSIELTVTEMIKNWWVDFVTWK